MDITARNTNDLFYLDPHPENESAVFLLHGLGTEASSWTYQIEALGEAGYRPVAPDLPGFGRSKYHGERWSIREAAGIITSLADRMDIQRFHLAGISMGGTVALRMAVDYPQKITSLVLMNTFASLKPKRWNEWFYLLKRYFKARFHGVGAQAELTAARIFPRAEQEELRQELIRHIRQTDPGVYKNAMRELGLFDARRELQSIHIPTLVITGEKDSTVPLENQRDLAAGIPDCRQVFIPNAGHGVIIDQPDNVNKRLVEFLNQHSI